jgi:hypothetical protein
MPAWTLMREMLCVSESCSSRAMRRRSSPARRCPVTALTNIAPRPYTKSIRNAAASGMPIALRAGTQ